MFTRKRSRTKMSDMAQLRKEVDAIVEKINKDLDKALENFKNNEKVKQLITKLQDATQKLRLDIAKKFDGAANVDIGTVRKEFDQAVAKIAGDFKKDAAQLGESATEIQGKLSTYFHDFGQKVSEKYQDFYVRDEAVKIRIEIEKKLSEMSTALEKEYENIRDFPAAKEMIKNLRKINESVGKEIGKRMDEFKNDRIDVQQNVQAMLKKISDDFEKTAKNANEQEKAILQKVKNKTGEISANIGESFEKLRKSVQNLKISEELRNIQNNAEKSLTSMGADFKEKVRKLEKTDVHFIDEITKNFAVASDKMREELKKVFETFHEDSAKAREKVKELWVQFSGEFHKRVESLKGSEVMKDVVNTVEEVSKKASSEISYLVDGFKKRLDEFENQDRVVEARKEMESIFTGVEKNIEEDFQAAKDNPHVKEAASKLKEINQKVHESINQLLSSAKTKEGEFETEMKAVFDKMHQEYEEAMVHIKDNPNVQELLKKAQGLSQKVSDEVAKVLKPIRENETVQSIVENVKATAETVKENVNDIANQAENSASKIYKDFREKASGVFSGTQKENEPKVTGSRSLSSESSAAEKAMETIKKLVMASLLYTLFLIKSTPQLIKHIISLFQPKSLDSKVIVITGTGSGLGKALAKKCLRLGAKVACVDINQSTNAATGEELLKKAKCHTCVRTYSCDISKPESCKKLAKEIEEDYGRVDILINNAGILGCHGINDADDAAIQRVVDVNLMSNFWMVRAFLPLMKARKEGQIVFINSQAGIHGLAKASSYAASKAGLLGLAYSLESEIRKDRTLEKIQITSVHPLYFVNSRSTSDTDSRTIMTTDAVADWTLHGIRRNLFTFAVPIVYGGFVVSSVARLLPPKVYHALIELLGFEKRRAVLRSYKD